MVRLNKHDWLHDRGRLSIWVHNNHGFDSFLTLAARSNINIGRYFKCSVLVLRIHNDLRADDRGCFSGSTHFNLGVHFDRLFMLSGNVDFWVFGSWNVGMRDTDVGVYIGSRHGRRVNCDVRSKIRFLRHMFWLNINLGVNDDRVWVNIGRCDYLYFFFLVTSVHVLMVCFKSDNWLDNVFEVSCSFSGTGRISFGSLFCKKFRNNCVVRVFLSVMQGPQLLISLEVASQL